MDIKKSINVFVQNIVNENYDDAKTALRDILVGKMRQRIVECDCNDKKGCCDKKQKKCTCGKCPDCKKRAAKAAKKSSK